MNMCKGAAKGLAIDMAFVMEGKKEVCTASQIDLIEGVRDSERSD